MKGIIAARPITMLGIALLVVGFAGPWALTTLVVRTGSPKIAGQFPSGTSTSPTLLEPNTTYTLKASVQPVDYNADDPLQTIVKVSITGTGQTLTLTYKSKAYPAFYYEYAGWASPGPGTSLAFNWSVTDQFGATGSSVTYATTASLGEGYFTIEGQKITSTTDKVYVGKNTFNVTFTKTKDPVTEAWFVVQDSAGNWKYTKADTVKTTFPASWSVTLADGTYDIRGYFTSYGQSVQVMSVFGGFNTEPTPFFPKEEPDVFFWMKVIGAALVVVGVITRR